MNFKFNLFVYFFLFVLVFGSVNAYSNQTGLISEWRMENNSLDFLNRNNGVIIGTLYNDTGILGNGLKHNNVSGNYMTMLNSASLNLTSAFTMCIWLKDWNATGLNQNLFAKYSVTGLNRSWMFSLSDNGQLQLTLSDNGTNTAGGGNSNLGLVNVSGWKFICAKWDKTILNGAGSFNLNGTRINISVSSKNMTNNIFTNDRNVTIGKYESAVRSLNEVVDEATIWNRSLSDTEIMSMYNDYLIGIRPTDNDTSISKNISIDSNFDSGSINSSLISGNTINFTLKEESVSCTGYNQCRAWTYFKVSNLTIGTTYTFNVNNVDSTTANPWNVTGFELVRSCNNSDRTSWDRISTYTKTSSTVGQFTFLANCNDTYIAEYFPYSYTDGMNYYSSLSSSYLTKSILTTSTNYSLNVTLFKITNSSISDSDKFKIVIVARQHPNEVAGSFFVEGMVNYLLNSSNANFSTLLNNYVFYIITPLNPDGVYNGTSRRTINNIDMNRAWNITSILDIGFVKEVNDTNNYIKTLGLNNKSLFIDVHGNGGIVTTAFIVDSTSAYNSSGFYDRLDTLEQKFYDNTRFGYDSATTFNEGISNFYYYQNYSGNVLSLGLEVPLFSSSNTINNMIMDGENVTKAILQYYGLSNVSMCSPLWVQNNSVCNGVNYTIRYYDSNNCSVNTSLPIDNGSVVYCGINISNVLASAIDCNSYVISWTTHTNSNSSIRYGLNSSLNLSASLNDNVTSHSLTLSSLICNSTYLYNITSRNPYAYDSFFGNFTANYTAPVVVLSRCTPGATSMWSLLAVVVVAGFILWLWSLFEGSITISLIVMATIIAFLIPWLIRIFGLGC